MSIQDIAQHLTSEQKKTCRESLGDALDIISGIVGDMPYSRLFAITIAVLDII